MVGRSWATVFPIPYWARILPAPVTIRRLFPCSISWVIYLTVYGVPFATSRQRLNFGGLENDRVLIEEPAPLFRFHKSLAVIVKLVVASVGGQCVQSARVTPGANKG